MYVSCMIYVSVLTPFAPVHGVRFERSSSSNCYWLLTLVYQVTAECNLREYLNLMGPENLASIFLF